MLRIDYNYDIIPLEKSIDKSGDLALIIDKDDYCYLVLVDGLGHGAEANKAAKIAITYLEQNISLNFSQVLKDLHQKLIGSRGVVISLCHLDKNSGKLLFSGIGNITTRIVGFDSFRFVPPDGILGYNIPTPRLQSQIMKKGDILLMYSDGIKESFDFLDTPGIEKESAESITSTLIQHYGKNNDDTSLIVLKVLK